MPDGSIDLQRIGIDAACRYMDNPRLTTWGLVILRGGSGKRLKWDSDDEQLDKRVITPADRDAAAALHSAVIRLPELRQRLVLQVFYREMCASRWPGGMSPRRQGEILDDLTGEVNDRIGDYDEDMRTVNGAINVRDFEGIRWRAIRILCNNERVMGIAKITPRLTDKSDRA